MKRSKKIVFYVAALLMAMFVCACSSQKESDNDDKKVNNEENEKKDDDKDAKSEQKEDDNKETNAKEKENAKKDSAKAKKTNLSKEEKFSILNKSLVNKEWYAIEAKVVNEKTNEKDEQGLGFDLKSFSDSFKFDAEDGPVTHITIYKGKENEPTEFPGQFTVDDSKLCVTYNDKVIGSEEFEYSTNDEGGIEHFVRKTKDSNGRNICVTYRNKKDSPECFDKNGKPIKKWDS